MVKLKSERHHWWPECVSDFWKDAAGCVNCLLTDGTIRKLPPKNFGVIVKGHHIKMVDDQNQTSAWEESFEHEFQEADSNFPFTIRWLQSLDRADRQETERKNRYLAQPASKEQIGQVIECLISLATRSPMNREAAVSVAERLRGPLSERERNLLIGINMRHEHRRAVTEFGTRGKIAIIYSPNREFIFGDGFYHNLTSPSGAPACPKILAPLTPEISVLYAIPFRYLAEPQLSTLVIDPDEALLLNNTVQIYARKFIFYRSEMPSITNEYRQECHRRYIQLGNPVDQMIDDLAGV